MPNPRLRKLPITVLKDSVGFQIPAPGVDVTPYKRGAITDRPNTSMTGGMAAGAGRTLNLRDSSMLRVNDVLQKGTSSGVTATVTAIVNGATVTVTVSGGTMTLATNDRLVVVGPAGRVPTIYTDPIGNTTTSSLTTDTNGYAQCFVKERVCDLLIGMSSGSITPIFREAETSGDDEVWINAANYDTIQDAIDACPDVFGNRVGTIVLPSGLYAVPTTINVDKSVRIIGDGIGSTVLLFDPGKNTDVFNVSASYVCIENLSINNEVAGSGTGRGIVIGDTLPMGGVVIRHVEILDSPSWGIYVDTGDGTGNSYLSKSIFDHVVINRPRSNGGFYGGKDLFTTNLRNISVECASVSPAGAYCIHLKNPTSVHLDTIDLAPAPNTTAIRVDKSGTGTGDEGALGLTIANCDIEAASGSTAKAIYIEKGKGVNLYGNHVLHFSYGIELVDCEYPVLVGNTWKLIGTTAITFTTCTDQVVVADRQIGTNPGETVAVLTIAETTSPGGTYCVNGVVQVPRYTTGNLPAGGATSRRAGSLAYDTTTNTLKVMRNDLTTWANVP